MLIMGIDLILALCHNKETGFIESSLTNKCTFFKNHIKIYIKIHINIAPTCFGLQPSSGSLHWTWLKLYLY